MKQFIFLKKLLAVIGFFGTKTKDDSAVDETFTEDRGIDFVITTYGLHSAEYKRLVQTLRLIQSFGGDEMNFDDLEVDVDETLMDKNE
jgi:hypothetical protein